MEAMMRSPALAVAALLAGAPAFANPASEALRARAAVQFYNLDIEEALALYRQAVNADPDDAAAHRGLASALWASLTFSRGMLTVDNYLGGISRQNLKLPPPPPATASAFHTAAGRAIALSRARVTKDPRNANAHYDLGSAIGLTASYAATIEGGMMGAFRAAREAFNAHEKVLELSPTRRDAGLIVGTYRYIVSALAMPVRWAAYVAGFGGGKEQGMKLIEAAAEYPSESQADARFALVLVYNRERRFDDAVRQLAKLMDQYPRNRLLWLEAGATALRAGRGADADRFLTDGVNRLAEDTRVRMFGEEALWFYKRGAARALAGRPAEAEQDLRKAVSLEGRRWVTGRARIELGRLALKAGDRVRATRELREGATLCESDGDSAFAAAARRLL
jgi:tetratricopeptide (TPR) repeat protein